MRPPCALSPSRIITLTSVLASLALCACNLDNLGDPPPDADLYLPTGLLLSQQSTDSAPRFLYVVNSNFDLRYNRGSVQAYDLEALNVAVDACSRPGIGCEIPSVPLLVDEVLIPSLATSFSVSPDRKRLYVATRTDASMTFIDLDESAQGEAVLDCAESERRCSDARNRGADPNDNPRGLTFPSEPVGMWSLHARDAAAGLDPDQTPGDFVMVAHRGGQVSLFHDPGAGGPRLVHVLEGLPLEPTGLTFEPASRLFYLSLYARNSVITGQTRLLARVGLTVEAGQGGGLAPSFAYDAGSIVVDGVAAQRDTRAIAVNPVRSGELLVAGRDPASLLFVDTQLSAATQDSAALTNFPARDIVPVGSGPTRMALGKLGERDLVAVSCFDGHQLYLVDAASREVVAVVHNLNGPFELAIDGVRKRLYIADFRSSSVQIIDLSAVAADGTGPRTDAPILATLGIPKVVQELQ